MGDYPRTVQFSSTPKLEVFSDDDLLKTMCQILLCYSVSVFCGR